MNTLSKPKASSNFSYHISTVITCILPALDVSPHLDFTLIAVGSWQFNPPLNFTRIFKFNPHSKLMKIKIKVGSSTRVNNLVCNAIA